MAYDPIKAQTICDLLQAQEDGCQSLRKCCQRVGVAHSTFLEWCDSHKDLADQYARADKAATEIQFEVLQDALNEAPAMVSTKFGEAIDPAWVNLKRLKVDTIKWALSKRRPSKYGERVTHAGDADQPIELVVRRIGPKGD